MRGSGYHLLTRLLTDAGHTLEQASAAVARLESDVRDFAQGNVASTGRRCPDGRSDDYVDGWSDVLVRGYLKEHPGIVAHRPDLLEALVETVRESVDQKRESANYVPQQANPADDHKAAVMEYTEHTCNCEYCLQA